MTMNGCLNNITGCYVVYVVQIVHFHISLNKPPTFGYIYSALHEVRKGSTDMQQSGWCVYMVSLFKGPKATWTPPHFIGRYGLIYAAVIIIDQRNKRSVSDMRSLKGHSRMLDWAGVIQGYTLRSLQYIVMCCACLYPKLMWVILMHHHEETQNQSLRQGCAIENMYVSYVSCIICRHTAQTTSHECQLVWISHSQARYRAR